MSDGATQSPPPPPEGQDRRLTPVSSTERITLIDALRGFALAGVLLANLTWFTGYQFLTDEVTATFPTVLSDRVLTYLILFFVDQKFITLFSYLFGLGFAVQLMRAEERGTRIRPVYVRRMGVLLLFGVSHLVFLWNGDILTAYALLGFLLILFVRRSSRTLLVWGLILGGLVGLLEITLVVLLAGIGPQGESGLYSEAFEAFTEGTYREALSTGLTLLSAFIGKMVLALYPFILGRFLLGFWAGRRRLFHDPESNRDLLRRIRRLGWMIGVPIWTLCVVLFVLNSTGSLSDQSPWMALFGFLPFGALFLAAFYAAGFTLLYLNPSWKKRLDVFAPVGRMALTNYLCQSIVSVLVFYGWGLGLSARFQVGPTIYVVYWILFFIAQIYFSRWWLSRFQFGPFEWLWRSLTYMKLQPMRIA